MIENWKTIQFESFISAAMLNGLIRAESRSKVIRHQFFGRKFSWVDPVKEIKAKKDEIALMLTDPISELERNGEDPEEVVERFSAWIEMLKSRGLDEFWRAAFDKTPLAEVNEETNINDNKPTEETESEGEE